jgi:hypothetical protein
MFINAIIDFPAISNFLVYTILEIDVYSGCIALKGRENSTLGIQTN